MYCRNLVAPVCRPRTRTSRYAGACTQMESAPTCKAGCLPTAGEHTASGTFMTQP